MICNKNVNCTLSNLPFPVVTKMKVLGTILNDKLTWDDHIENTVKRCNRRFFILRKLKHYLSPKELQMIYSGIMQSLLEYSCTAFVNLPKRLEKKIQRVDNRAFKFIYPDRQDRYKHGWKPNRMQKRRGKMSKKLFLTISRTQHHLLHKYIPDRLHYSKHFRLQKTRTEKYKHSFFPYVTSLLNKEN